MASKNYGRKMADRLKKQREAEEEFIRQVDAKCGYYGMSRCDLAREVPMPKSTLSDMLAEPKMLRVWQLMRIMEVLKLDVDVVIPILSQCG